MGFLNPSAMMAVLSPRGDGDRGGRLAGRRAAAPGLRGELADRAGHALEGVERSRVEAPVAGLDVLAELVVEAGRLAVVALLFGSFGLGPTPLDHVHRGSVSGWRAGGFGPGVYRRSQRTCVRAGFSSSGTSSKSRPALLLSLLLLVNTPSWGPSSAGEGRGGKSLFFTPGETATRRPLI